MNLCANDLSEYAGHSIRLSEPSPLPIFVGKPAFPFALPVVAAGMQSITATAAARTYALLTFFMWPPCQPFRDRARARDASPAAPSARVPRAPPARTSRGSDERRSARRR